MLLATIAASCDKMCFIVCSPCFNADWPVRIGRFGTTLFSIWGLVVCFQLKGHTESCSQMYDVAWWCFLAIPLVLLAFPCFLFCCCSVLTLNCRSTPQIAKYRRMMARLTAICRQFR